MRALLVMALLSGCAAPAPVDASSGAAGTATLEDLLVPDALRVEGAFTAGQSILEEAGKCGAPSACQEVTFELARNATVASTLEWERPTNDLDVYLYRGDAFIAMSRSAGAGTREAFSTHAEAGSYRLIIVPFASGPETFVLEATFAPVP